MRNTITVGEAIYFLVPMLIGYVAGIYAERAERRDRVRLWKMAQTHERARREYDARYAPRPRHTRSHYYPIKERGSR